MAKYSSSSPYYKTAQNKDYLDVMVYIDLPTEVDDSEYVIDKKYEYRPDLLAYDLYDNVNLWWVFSVRNKNIIRDPVFDFVSGTRIFLPKISTINNVLGI